MRITSNLDDDHMHPRLAPMGRLTSPHDLESTRFYQQVIDIHYIPDFKENFPDIVSAELDKGKTFTVNTHSNFIGGHSFFNESSTSSETQTPRQQLHAVGEFPVESFYYIKHLLDTDGSVCMLGRDYELFKEYIPSIVRIGPPDCGDFDDVLKLIFYDGKQLDRVFSICALSFVSFEMMKKRLHDFFSIIAKGGRGYISLNVTSMIKLSDNRSMLEGLTRVKLTDLVKKSIASAIKKSDVTLTLLHVSILYKLDDDLEGNIRLLVDKT